MRKLLAEFPVADCGDMVARVCLDDDVVSISYVNAAFLDEPPYWDERWESMDFCPDADPPPMRCDWSDTWTSPDMGASLTVEQLQVVMERLKK